MSEDATNEKHSGQNISDRTTRVKREAVDILKNDLIGASEWKSSKIGYLTGFSTLKRSIGTVGNSFSESSERLSLLVNSLTNSEDLPELEPGGTAEQRFQESMALHNKKPADLPIILRNTYFSALLYATLSLAYLVILIGSLWYYHPHDLFAALIRIGPLPAIMALFFKHAYTNWIVRAQRLGTPKEFIFSGEFMPSLKMNPGPVA